MELEKVYQSIIDGKAMLITGSGAHTDVLTPDGCKFPSGIDLARTIYSACGITNPENPYDLQDAADTFLEKKFCGQIYCRAEKNAIGWTSPTRTQGFIQSALAARLHNQL